MHTDHWTSIATGRWTAVVNKMKHYGCHLTNMLAKALSTTNKLITKPPKHHLNEMCNMFWWQKFNPVIHDNFVFSCILQQIVERKLTSKVNMQINQTTSWRQAGWKIPPNKHTYMHTHRWTDNPKTQCLRPHLQDGQTIKNLKVQLKCIPKF